MLLLGVIVGGIGVAIYMWMSPRTGQMPEYAQLAPADAPLFSELTLPTGALAEPAALAESRLLSELGQANALREWRDFFGEDDEAAAAVRRVALLPLEAEGTRSERQRIQDSRRAAAHATAQPVGGVTLPSGFALLFEFDDAAARKQFRLAHLESHAAEHVVARAFEYRARPLLALVPAREPHLLELLAQRLRTPASENLASSERLQEALTVNRPGGLFAYLDAGSQWPHLREALAASVELAHEAGTPLLPGRHEELLAGLDELLAPAELGAHGVWLGLEESEAARRVADHPLYRTGLLAEREPDLLKALPANTPAFAHLALFERSAGDSLEALATRCPRLWRFAANLLRHAPEGHDWDRVQHKLERLGEHASGQLALGVSELAGDPHFVVAAGVREPHSLAQTLREEFALAEEAEADTAAGPVFRDDPSASLFVHEQTFLLVLSLVPQEKGAPATMPRMRYLEALAQTGTLAESATANELAELKSPATLVAAVHPRRLLTLLAAKEDATLAAVREAFSPQAWVTLTSRFDGEYERTHLNVGVRDLVALALAVRPQFAELEKRLSAWWTPRVAMLTGRERMPRFARYLPADAPLLLELPVPAGLLSGAEQPSDEEKSRFLSEAGRNEFARIHAQLFTQQGTGKEEGPLAGLTHLAVLPLSADFTLAFEPGTAVALVFEFETPERLHEARLPLRRLFQREVFTAHCDEGRALAFVTNASFPPDIERFADSLRKPPTQSLADTAAFQRAARMHRGYGLFAYVNVEARWNEMREPLRDMLREPLRELESAAQREVFRALEQLLEPRRLGPVSVWMGERETLAVLPGADNHPLLQTGLLGPTRVDTKALAALPGSTFAKLELGTLEASFAHLERELQRLAPRAWRLLREVHADAEVGSGASFEEVLERYGVLIDEAAGPVVLGAFTFEEAPYLLVRLPLDDAKAVRESVAAELAARHWGAPRTATQGFATPDSERRDSEKRTAPQNRRDPPERPDDYDDPTENHTSAHTEAHLLLDSREASLWVEAQHLSLVLALDTPLADEASHAEREARMLAAAVHRALESYIRAHGGLRGLPAGEYSLLEALPEHGAPSLAYALRLDPGRLAERLERFSLEEVRLSLPRPGRGRRGSHYRGVIANEAWGRLTFTRHTAPAFEPAEHLELTTAHEVYHKACQAHGSLAEAPVASPTHATAAHKGLVARLAWQPQTARFLVEDFPVDVREAFASEPWAHATIALQEGDAVVRADVGLTDLFPAILFALTSLHEQSPKGGQAETQPSQPEERTE